MNIGEKIEDEMNVLLESNEFSLLIGSLNEITGIDALKLKLFSLKLFELFKIFMIKNMAYKDSYKKHGVLGLIIRISDKIDRLYNLENENIPCNDETKEDTFSDIAVYSILGNMEIEERKK